MGFLIVREGMMMKARLNRRTDMPWWAALGAPLIGVPLLVGLLAVTAPASPSAVLDEAPAALDVVAVDAPLDVEGCGEGSELYEG